MLHRSPYSRFRFHLIEAAPLRNWTVVGTLSSPRGGSLTGQGIAQEDCVDHPVGGRCGVSRSIADRCGGWNLLRHARRFPATRRLSRGCVAQGRPRRGHALVRAARRSVLEVAGSTSRPTSRMRREPPRRPSFTKPVSCWWTPASPAAACWLFAALPSGRLPLRFFVVSPELDHERLVARFGLVPTGSCRTHSARVPSSAPLKSPCAATQ